MKQINALLAASAIALSPLFAVPALAETAPDQAKMEMGSETGSETKPAMTEGEVRKIDKAAGKLTIKHGDIKHMDMPGMTMVFVASDKAMLDTLKAGDKISFMVIKENGKLAVTDVKVVK